MKLIDSIVAVLWYSYSVVSNNNSDNDNTGSIVVWAGEIRSSNIPLSDILNSTWGE